jgi:DNA polymerase-1
MNMPSRPRLFLIDGHALAYRTYFALTGVGGGARFTTKSGETTAGVYGFVSVLLRLLENEKPEYLAVSFDTGKTFRDEIFPEYKGTREKMPEDLASQLVRIHELVEAFGIPIYEMEGYEADDVLGAMANGAAAQGVHTIILTGDRDLLQLSTNDITIRLAGQKLSEAIDYGPKEATTSRVCVALGIRRLLTCSSNTALSMQFTNTSRRSLHDLARNSKLAKKTLT